MNTAVAEREPLVTISGTVLEKTAAPSARHPGKVKLTNGKILHVFPEKLQQIQDGQTYEFGCSTSEYKGVLQLTMRSFKHITPHGHQANVENYPSRQAERAGVPASEPRQAKPPQPSSEGGYYRPTSPADKKSMFRCACITAFIRAGQLRIDQKEIAAAIAEIDAGYDMGVNDDNLLGTG